jgi:hypothetical protein
LRCAETVMAENGRKPTEIHKLPPGRSSFHTAWVDTGCSLADRTVAVRIPTIERPRSGVPPVRRTTTRRPRHADRPRTDVASLESGLEVIMEQVARRWAEDFTGETEPLAEGESPSRRFGCHGIGRARILLRRASMRRKIAPNGPGIPGMSDKGLIFERGRKCRRWKRGLPVRCRTLHGACQSRRSWGYATAAIAKITGSAAHAYLLSHIALDEIRRSRSRKRWIGERPTVWIGAGDPAHGSACRGLTT